jgi:UDP-glucose 4-epimerase
MIMITGGLGFIGAHTARALLDLGESVLVTRHVATEVPEFIRSELGGRLIVEPLDIEDWPNLLEIGRRHPITGIVHLADTAAHRLWRRPGDPTPLRLEGLFDSLFYVLRAADDWDARRVTIASTIGVYGGVTTSPWKEEAPLPMVASHAIPTVKKSSELLAKFVGDHIDVEVVTVRPSAIWGPGGRPTSSFLALPSLVHAAVRHDAEPISHPVYAQDGGDLCYVKDCGRAIAMVQTAATLNHTTYNIGSGRKTTNAEIVAAIHNHLGEARFDMAEGSSPNTSPVDPVLDLTRIRADTGYHPAYDLERGISDYIAWLGSGHPR